MSDTQIWHPQHWQPWQMNDLNSTCPQRQQRQHARQQEAEQDQVTERENVLEIERRQAYRQAHERGYTAGYEEGKQKGHAKGLEEGLAEGRRELQQQTQESLAALLPLIESFNQALAQQDEEIANTLVELALATGHQLAGAALKETPEQITEIVRELMHLEPALAGHPRLRLHPKDLELVKNAIGQELAALGWKLHADDQLTRGGCRVTSPSGELDATWEQRCAGVTDQIRRRATSQPSETRQ